jgi:hypothetical protein
MFKFFKLTKTTLLPGLFSVLVLLPVSCCRYVKFPDKSVAPSESDQVYPSLAVTWDEAVPLGNAVVGSLVWEKEGNLRMSLDRTDLWDLRPMDSLSGDRFKFSWVTSHVVSGDYLPVQQKLDVPYDRDPAPSKIPGAALEFGSLGEVDNVRLYLGSALCEVLWKNGTKMYSFIDSDRPVGWFVFENVPEDFRPVIVPPPYSRGSMDAMDPVTGQDLSRLGYSQGEVVAGDGLSSYHQEGWGGFSYDVAVKWKNVKGKCAGAWSVTSSMVPENASSEVEEAFIRGMAADRKEHVAFWKDFWSQSSVSIPDPVLQKQYDNEMYKFGSAAREDSYPISLQAVWTADNGKLPPWKGDYHHDLNTQLSYWPSYVGNHLSEESGYLNTLWNQRDVFHAFTRQYFEKDGLAIPGVCTLTGEPMGGWIQYSLSQTTSSWLAQHFYLHWKYSMDEDFLRERGYPFVKDVAVFLEQQTVLDDSGHRTLEFSTSPEIYDNSLKAWFRTISNYDNALITNTFKMAAEMASALSLSEEASHWDQLRSEMPPFALSEDGALEFAEGFPYNESHRHFSHSMAIHPLGLLNWEDGEESRRIIKATIDRLEFFGPSYWTGFSYSWFANMLAWTFDGERTRRYLRDFAECFCLPNTFHANGDQTRTGKSRYLYRPFTLEGNMAFASGVQQMLLQSHTDTIRVFPAIPEDWRDVSFRDLRVRGAFLVSAERKDGRTVSVKVLSEKGGELLMISPFDGSVIKKEMKPGEEMEIRP